MLLNNNDCLAATHTVSVMGIEFVWYIEKYSDVGVLTEKKGGNNYYKLNWYVRKILYIFMQPWDHTLWILLLLILIIAALNSALTICQIHFKDELKINTSLGASGNQANTVSDWNSLSWETVGRSGSAENGSLNPIYRSQLLHSKS